MPVQINDLSTDLLKYIFSFLSDKRIFMIESVCKKWQICARKLLETKNDLRELDYYSTKFYNPKQTTCSFFIDDNNFEILNNILTKYRNIKDACLTGAHITCNLVELAKLCPKLERINLYKAWIDVSEDEMIEFAKLIGPQLVECDLTYCNVDFVKIIPRYSRKIEEFIFDTENKLDAKELFSHLKSCENLKILGWKIIDIYGKNPEEEIDGQDKNMIDVIQRISKLNTLLFIFSQFKFEMNNLTKLTLHGSCNAGLKDFQANQLKLNNLVKLTLEDFDVENFFAISKFEFPKLESVAMRVYDQDTPTSFFDQIKHIKSLNCAAIESNLISSLESKLFKLIDFKCTYVNFGDYLYSQYCQLFDVLSKHKSLQNIRINITEFDFKFDLFEKMVSLSRAKPDANINIKISVHNPNRDGFDEYKKKFKETKQSATNLNLKMISMR